MAEVLAHRPPASDPNLQRELASIHRYHLRLELSQLAASAVRPLSMPMLAQLAASAVLPLSILMLAST